MSEITLHSNQSYMKARTLFITDIVVLIAFLLTSVSGFLYHLAGHQDSHEYWHNCAIFHIVSTLALIISVSTHVYGHWNWYKSLFQKRLGNKSRVTVFLSSLMLATIITGNIVLLRHQGPNSHFGLWHYVIGIMLTVIAVGHFLKRIKILVKGLKQIKK